MSDTFSTSPIGHCEMIDGRFAIRLMPDNREGLSGLADFSHAIALWWAHQADSADLRTRLTVKSPYTVSFADFGVFSTRSEARPNPIGLTVFSLASINQEEGVVYSHYFDMLPGTPILDLKPYFPASDRVTEARAPVHFSHWPSSLEASAEFDWDNEFRD